MKVTVLGTGTFYVDKDRSGPAYLLETDGKKVLVDCGPGTLMRLSEIGVKPIEIDYVFLSHFHPDHSGDLFALQMNFRLNEFFGTEKLEKYPTVFGPEGIKDFTKKLSHIYQLPAFESWSNIKYKEYFESESIKLDNLIVKSYKVSHNAFGQLADAYALRFESEGKVFAFSGDSIKSEGVERVAENADLFICDASYVKGKGSPAHMDTLEIGEIAEKAKAKRVVLSHFYPNTENVDLVAEVKEEYSGEVARGEDLMEIKI